MFFFFFLFRYFSFVNTQSTHTHTLSTLDFSSSQFRIEFTYFSLQFSYHLIFFSFRKTLFGPRRDKTRKRKNELEIKNLFEIFTFFLLKKLKKINWNYRNWIRFNLILFCCNLFSWFFVLEAISVSPKYFSFSLLILNEKKNPLIERVTNMNSTFTMSNSVWERQHIRIIVEPIEFSLRRFSSCATAVHVLSLFRSHSVACSPSSCCFVCCMCAHAYIHKSSSLAASPAQQRWFFSLARLLVCSRVALASSVIERRRCRCRQPCFGSFNVCFRVALARKTSGASNVFVLFASERIARLCNGARVLPMKIAI